MESSPVLDPSSTSVQGEPSAAPAARQPALKMPLLSDSHGCGHDDVDMAAGIAPPPTRSRSSSEEADCRICKETGGNLIAPCQCKGSVQWVHAECLQAWLTSRGNNGNMRCEICQDRYKIVYEQRLACTYGTLCSGRSWNSYFECVGVCIMISCLVITLLVLYKHRHDAMAFDTYTNYAVMTVLGFVLLFASLVTVKRIFSRWRQDNSHTVIRPMPDTESIYSEFPQGEPEEEPDREAV